MGIKKGLLILLLFSLLGGGIYAQADDDAPVEVELPYRISESDSGLFIQRLSWNAAQYAVRYNVILERKGDESNVYTEVLRRNVETSYIDISVPPGEYRYQVLSYNVLGMIDSQSDWEYFTIIAALYPVILTFSPKAFYFDRLTPRIISLTGENLLPESEMYLENKTTLDEDGKPVIMKPKEILRNELGESARLVFNEEDLVAGRYNIVVKNPGGNEARIGDFIITMAKPYDINVAAGVMPMFTVYGQKEYVLDHVFIPLSFGARASFIPFKWKIGFWGAELNASWAYLGSDQPIAKTTAHLLLVNAGGVFQYWLMPKELSVNGRISAGFAGIIDWKFQFNDTGKFSDPINTSAFMFSVGSSVQWYFYKQIFVEGGFDYIHIAHKDIPMDFIRIGIYGGYQF